MIAAVTFECVNFSGLREPFAKPLRRCSFSPSRTDRMSDTDGFESPPSDDNNSNRATMSGSPIGIRRADVNGLEMIDAMAGRASVFGFGFEPITEAIQAVAESYLGDASALVDDPAGDDDSLCGKLRELLGDSPAITPDSISLCASADMAVETAIGFARRFRPEKSFRTIALLGSDHGRSGVCRTASGRPELQQGYGPMMAGFAHVNVGDLDAMRATIDEQTACILLSPVDLRNAARPLDADYLSGVRELCDEHEILLVVDETRLAFGSSGQPLAFSAIANVHADVVVLASGLFAGLAGGIVLASQKVTGDQVLDTHRYPLLAAVACETLSSMHEQNLPASASDSMRDFAVALAEQLSGFEFVRDVNVLGMSIGIETDIDSADIVAAAERRGLRIETAGNTAIRIQPPLVISREDQETLLARLGETIEAIERETAELSI